MWERFDGYFSESRIALRHPSVINCVKLNEVNKQTSWVPSNRDTFKVVSIDSKFRGMSWRILSKKVACASSINCPALKILKVGNVGSLYTHVAYFLMLVGSGTTETAEPNRTLGAPRTIINSLNSLCARRTENWGRFYGLKIGISSEHDGG